jgi:hypothetical protein
MKIKTGFVTNSSSTTYIIIDTNDTPLDIEKELIEWDKETKVGRFDYFELNEVASFAPDEIKKFKTFNNYDKELDWVEEATGARYNKVGSRKIYSNILNILSKGKAIHFLVVNNNMNLLEFIDCSNNLKLAYCSDD